MLLDDTRTRRCLKEFDFRTLFVEELGWDRHRAPLDIVVDGRPHTLAAIAQKRGMVAFTCPPLANGRIPDYPIRRKIEQQVAKSVNQHLIVYMDDDRTTQVWQWVKREMGRPTACREHTYHVDQPGDGLIQKLQSIAFSLDEEEGLSIVDVISRARAAFDLERVTKRFYDRFKAEHAAFLAFLKGIPDGEMQRWYASVMLNRLMFIYFIQKKGFLDGDTNYLRSKLSQSKQRGRDLFYSHLLCPLFFEGFAKRESDRSVETNWLLGRVPYLNGGLFMRHQIEEAHGQTIAIADAAFERLFAFFEQYQWHLDERPLRADNEINPDVLGYIFEKYINQKQMGAYYTKEDITEYIGKNTVIPYLFDVARQKCRIAFEGQQSVWRLLQAEPDRYIYPAVKKGVDKVLPSEIAAGLNDVARRTEWNKPAPAEYALPTEIWREVVARRRRYEEVRAKMADGAITSINDLITYNLDIRQFAQDVIENSEGPELLRALYHAIEKVTVLDPTCGSGAFLFAALNILEPLYEACLERMESFVADLERSAGRHRPERFADFKKVLADVGRHANRRYFILKSIIVNNLFGVDIMEEAVEICKLRLFLKLVAQVERVEDIEPLPDIDFNIRAGNTLVGYATYEDVRQAIGSRLDFDNVMARIKERTEDVDRLFRLFRQQQTELGGEVTANDKQALRIRLKALEDELNRCLAGDYGVSMGNNGTSPVYQRWLGSHRPFHWFIEFHGIMTNGGFDVIVGNPPWKEYATVRKEYTVRSYATEGCGNLYCLCMERALNLRSRDGHMSFIVQLPLASSSRMTSARKLLRQCSGSLHIALFDDRPGKLFEGLEHCRSVVFLSRARGIGSNELMATTQYNRWHSETREHLFAQLQYTRVLGEPLFTGLFPKYAHPTQESLFRKVKSAARQVTGLAICHRVTNHYIFYQEATGYWTKATVGLPYYAKNGFVSAPSHGRFLYFDQEEQAYAFCALVNSSLFYAYFIAYGDCFHLSDTLASSFPVPFGLLTDEALVKLSKLLMNDLRGNAERKIIRTKDGDEIGYDEFYGWKSKPIIDQIDRVLAKHYGFTDEELDFIINYDIKYRMGLGNSQGDEDDE